MITLERSGVAYLPLHGGKAPSWLVRRMIKLADVIVKIIIDEYGVHEFLRRVSNPFWFQSFGCILGYDWHSSGVTTVVSGVLRTALKHERHGLAVCGGKGKRSIQTLNDIEITGALFNLSTSKIESLKYASRITAKIDNAAIQAGYPLYHHVFIVSEDGDWAVIQQGMNIHDKTARRYHWLSTALKDYVNEPHTAIVGNVVRRRVLDMTSSNSEDCRKICVDIVKDGPHKILNALKSIRPICQESLDKWFSNSSTSYTIDVLYMPRSINWDALRNAYETQPKNFEELLTIKGIGPATIRGLALISEVIYGTPPSWRDPVKYSFAFGGKDGVPFPVNREAMDEAIKFLVEIIEKAEINNSERMYSLKRLRSYYNIT
ncbi:MAG: DUF763 domain-containing protein [Candidatus Methanomethylicia archaeon]